DRVDGVLRIDDLALLGGGADHDATVGVERDHRGVDLVPAVICEHLDVSRCIRVRDDGVRGAEVDADDGVAQIALTDNLSSRRRDSPTPDHTNARARREMATSSRM